MFKRILDAIGCMIYPYRCHSCGSAAKNGEVFCRACSELWEKEKLSSCRNCGRSHINCSCLLEADDKGRLFSVYHLAEYCNQSVAGNSVLYLKSRQSKRLTDFFAEEMLDNICKGELFAGAVVTYVPRRREVVRERGSDQARDLAEAICRLSGNELVTAFKRKGRTDQKGLNSEERRKNAASSYQILPEVSETICGKSFYLVDDVITTGSTMVACAELLLQHGAKRVIAVSVARRTR